MEAAQTIASPVALPRSRGIFEAARKLTVIRLRWLVVIVCSYLLLSFPSASLGPATIRGLILLYLLTNLVLYRVPDRLFDSAYFYFPLVIFDTFFVTGCLVLSGQIETDFYLAYFLIVILCSLWQDFRGLAVVGALAPSLYGYFLFQSSAALEQSLYLRLPFLFVISLFYGYFAQAVRVEKRLNEELQAEAKGRRMIVEQLAEANRLKSEYLTNTSHELRTPIATMMGYAHLLTDGLCGPLNDPQKRTLARLVENARGLLRVVDQLLDYSKLEKGRAGLFSQRQDLGSLLDQIRRELAALEAGRPYRVQFEIQEGIPPFETDWGKLKNVIMNILENAIKFTDRGEVRLSVAARSKDEVSFLVADTGVGIPKDQIPVIFEKFRQLDGSMARRHEGAGLGLTISKNLVDLLGGRIEVESQVGRGSIFRVIVPVINS